MFKQSGFSLLEAMVAIVVLSMSLFATYSWINVSVLTLQRSDEVLSQELLVDEFMQQIMIDDVDAVGELRKKDLVLRWQILEVEKKEGRNNVGATGYFDHTLSEVLIEIRRDKEIIDAYTTRVVRSERVREPDEEMFL